MKKTLFLLTLLVSFTLTAQETEFNGQSCTSIMVGRLASADGSVITSHTCDGRYRTWSYMEPAADHEPGSMHQVLRGTMHTAFRGDTTGVKVMGEIPQAAHTYAYLNTAYPCTKSSWLSARPHSPDRKTSSIRKDGSLSRSSRESLFKDATMQGMRSV